MLIMALLYILILKRVFHSGLLKAALGVHFFLFFFFFVFFLFFVLFLCKLTSCMTEVNILSALGFT